MKNLLQERAYMALLMTMEKQSDRELLELAANSIGFELVYDELLGTFGYYDECKFFLFDPLANDGDALRLAVKLSLWVKVARRLTLVEMTDVGDDLHERHGNDPLRATRLCIVRAAAEIGRKMQDEQSTANLPEDNYEKNQYAAFYGDGK